MGNNSSKGSAASSAAPSAETSPQASKPVEAASNFPPSRRPRRRESIQVLPATAAAPVASLESATGEPSKPRASASHSRGRSQTSVTPLERPSESTDIMGNQLSTERNVDSTTPNRSRSPAPIDTSAGRDQAGASARDKTLSPRPTSSSASPPPYYLPTSQFGRAPRLPLPIEEEVLAPGSPIITPADVASPVDQKEVHSDIALPRRSSVLSSTTIDEEEIGDDLTVIDAGAGPTVDTLIEWKEGGERVYVTGTFAKFWTKKFRLHKHGPSKDPDAFSAIIPLPPGTHHLTFLVDNSGRTSRHMPTAVDWSNMLVNYIEISMDDIAKHTQPQDIPHAKTQQDRPEPLETQEPPSGQRDTPDAKPKEQQSTSTPVPQPKRQQSKDVKRLPPKKYHNEIPKFLLDLDAPEDSSRFQRANAVMGTQPAPPSLPMFLNKSILNGATPMKDDASVLIMPNHTVLNHLATSSIKEGVLATSATTRYKKKYVTTIMYKPTGDD